MDTEDGELSFRLGCPLDGGAVNEDLIRETICYTVSTFDNTYEEIEKAMTIDKAEDEGRVLKMARDPARLVWEAVGCLGTRTNGSINN